MGLAGKESPRWVGDKVGRNGMHKRIRRVRGDASSHIRKDCSSRAEDWSHVHNTDRLDVQNYEPRCTPCHMRYDNLGRRHTQATKDKISISKTGKPNPHTTAKCLPGCNCRKHTKPGKKCEPGCVCGRHPKRAPEPQGH